MQDLLTSIKRDEEGYLLNLADWNEAVAKAIAESENLKLTEEHWKVIHSLRNFYAEYHTSPTMRALINLLNKELTKNNEVSKKIDSIYLHTLFPNGPAKQANKIAGLPKPIRCI